MLKIMQMKHALNLKGFKGSRVGQIVLTQTTDISTLLISDNINFPVTQKPHNRP